MQEKELLQDCFENLEQDAIRQARKRYIKIGVFCAIVGIYLFFLLFGNNSWSVLLKLKQEKMDLETQVANLQDENVDLQKVIFELKGLEPGE